MQCKIPPKDKHKSKLLTLLGIKNMDSLVILGLWHFIIFPTSEASSVFHKKYLSASVPQRQPFCLPFSVP